KIDSADDDAAHRPLPLHCDRLVSRSECDLSDRPIEMPEHAVDRRDLPAHNRGDKLPQQLRFAIAQVYEPRCQKGSFFAHHVRQRCECDCETLEIQRELNRQAVANLSRSVKIGNAKTADTPVLGFERDTRDRYLRWRCYPK